MNKLAIRIQSKTRRTLASLLHRRTLKLQSSTPVISFSFDDAPRTAFDVAGPLLLDHGARATYFISMGLLGKHTEVGDIADISQLDFAVQRGHELGCHTFHHLDAWHSTTNDFIASVDANQDALRRNLPGYSFGAFAYPKSGPRVGVKAELERRFECCRGGGQSNNHGLVDLNLLSACFLDRWTGVDTAFINELIDFNTRSNGWLIFAAHDISNRPSPFACSVDFFGDVVHSAAVSGAKLLPVGEACIALRGLSIE